MKATTQMNKNFLEDQKDILELESRIQNFKSGKEDEEQFKFYRLTRGVYGQRQLGVQMFRIKIPYGRITPDQLTVVADISDKYASSNLHLTTRQDIQLHYVKLEDSPNVWRDLVDNGLTGREACGNTVRNLTASAIAGIDPEEAFDVSPYVEEMANYFLRNPICQEMGRKIKPAFSSSYKDSAYTFFHDFGFIPIVQESEGIEMRGFKVLIGGGLGAQAIPAQIAYEFLEADQIIPFMEAALRVFDRYGERQKRQKARLKFLVKSIGLEAFLELVEAEKKNLKNQSYSVDVINHRFYGPKSDFKEQDPTDIDLKKFKLWKSTNVFLQKQDDFFGVYLKVFLGDISSDKARALTPIIKKYASDDIRISINQGLLLRFVREKHLRALFYALDQIGFAEPGFDSIADITACPGTDTCNLAVTNSTGLSGAIEEFILKEYPHLIEERDIKIKISGCMNACGQHMIANIGFHGSSIKKNGLVIPAMQIVLAGGVDPEGRGRIAEKVIKLPTKRILTAIKFLLDDFKDKGIENEYFNLYFQRQGKKYFYDLLKPLASLTTVDAQEFIDWGQEQQYKQAIGVGECAGVVLDVVGTILKDAERKLMFAEETYTLDRFTDSIYHAYSSFVVTAKAMLLSEDHKCNTQIKILEDFDALFIKPGVFKFEGSFKEHVLKMKDNEASALFARDYINSAQKFLEQVIAHRKSNIDKSVISQYYNA